jgi:hypothetical protein
MSQAFLVTWEALRLTISIQAVRLVAQTGAGEAAFSHAFGPGLTVVRGSNTVGKSLLVQSILYALGLDDVFATRQGTLTRAMLIDVDTAQGTLPVIRSFVELEFAIPADGLVLTVRRYVKPDLGGSPHLIHVWPLAALTQSVALSDRGISTDYYVNRKGAATESSGFHVYLANLLGWKLPWVATYDDAQRPLYLQIIFGVCYVDQKRGWGGIVPQVPTKYGIIEPLRRAVEFVLDLDFLWRQSERRDIDDRLNAILTREEYVRGRLEAVARSRGGRVILPPLPNRRSRTPQSAMDGVVLDEAARVQVLTDDHWEGLDEAIEVLEQQRQRRAIAALEATSPTVDENGLHVSEAEDALELAESRLQQVSARLAGLNESDSLLEMQLGALGRRLAATEDEKRRYGQLGMLANLGSQLAESTLSHGDCPTCHQSLIGIEAVEGNAMSVEDTNHVLTQERVTVRGLIEQAERAIGASEVKRTVWMRHIAELRSEIRALKSDLTSTAGTPSIAEIQRAVTEEARLSALHQLRVQTIEDVQDWQALRSEMAEAMIARLALGNTELSSDDRIKMQQWEGVFRALLEDFQFVSVDPQRVSISEEMKPVVDGYDISFQGSASDGIRLRWAYLLSLWQRTLPPVGLHPGLLIMDEPGQQGVEDSALEALYQRCADLESARSQLFLTTSQSREQLEEWLGDRPCNYIEIDQGGLLQLS